jgi:hypothetical protein
MSTFLACGISGTGHGVQAFILHRSFAAVCLLVDIDSIYARGVGRSSYIFSRNMLIFAFLPFSPSSVALTRPASVVQHNWLEERSPNFCDRFITSLESPLEPCSGTLAMWREFRKLRIREAKFRLTGGFRLCRQGSGTS